MRVLATSCVLSLLAVSCGGSTAADEDAAARTVEVSDETAVSEAPTETAPPETTEAPAETTTTEAPAETTTSEAPATGSQADLDEFCRLTETSDELTSEFFGGEGEPTPDQVEACFGAQQALMNQMYEIADGVTGLIDILKDNGFDIQAANDAADTYVAETKLQEAADTVDAFTEANCGL